MAPPPPLVIDLPAAAESLVSRVAAAGVGEVPLPLGHRPRLAVLGGGLLFELVGNLRPMPGRLDRARRLNRIRGPRLAPGASVLTSVVGGYCGGLGAKTLRMLCTAIEDAKGPKQLREFQSVREKLELGGMTDDEARKMLDALQGG